MVKKIIVTMLLFATVFSGAAIGDVLVLAQGKSALHSDGSGRVVEKIKAQSGDLNWDVGETFEMSFDFAVSNPAWIRSYVGWVVGIGDRNVKLGFGARYQDSNTMFWNGNVDANASRGVDKIKIQLLRTSDRVTISRIDGTSADLRDDGDEAHFVFMATRDSATQYTLNLKWFTADRTVFDEMTVVRDEGKAVKTCSDLVFKINADSSNGRYEIKNLMMRLVPSADAHKGELPLKKPSEAKTIGLLTQ